MQSEALFEALHARDTDRVLAMLRATPALAHARDAHLGSTPLHFAAHRGMVAVVEALLALRVDVNAREAASGTTPMHWAAEAGHLEVARLLGRAGADIEVRDDWYALTPLGWATVVDYAPTFRADRPAVVAALRRAGARPELFVAVASDDVAEVSRLAHGAALAARLGFVADAWTPLHLAADRASAPTITMLLRNGADPTARSASGLTPLAVARLGRHTAAARAFRPVGGDDDVSVAVVTGDSGGVVGATLDRDLATRLLAAAARHGKADVVAALVVAGADVNGRSRHLVAERPAWLTPLHLAAREGHVDTVARLLDTGATIDLRCDGGPTALELAREAKRAEVEAVLIKRGASA